MLQGLGLLVGSVGGLLGLIALMGPSGAATNTCGLSLLAVIAGAILFMIGKRQAAAAAEVARMRAQAQMIAEEIAKRP